jgi:hypothetical protein
MGGQSVWLVPCKARLWWSDPLLLKTAQHCVERPIIIGSMFSISFHSKYLGYVGIFSSKYAAWDRGEYTAREYPSEGPLGKSNRWIMRIAGCLSRRSGKSLYHQGEFSLWNLLDRCFLKEYAWRSIGSENHLNNNDIGPNYWGSLVLMIGKHRLCWPH